MNNKCYQITIYTDTLESKLKILDSIHYRILKDDYDYLINNIVLSSEDNDSNHKVIINVFPEAKIDVDVNNILKVISDIDGIQKVEYIDNEWINFYTVRKDDKMENKINTIEIYTKNGKSEKEVYDTIWYNFLVTNYGDYQNDSLFFMQ